MSKTMQNLLVLMEPSEDASNISVKGGKMCFNRFCIDEDVAFELSGVYYLEKESQKLKYSDRLSDSRKLELRSRIKGKE